MTQQPRQIESKNLQSGIWFLNTKNTPPDNIRVLCSDDKGTMWFDSFIQGTWGSPISPNKFAWQVVRKPMIFD